MEALLQKNEAWIMEAVVQLVLKVDLKRMIVMAVQTAANLKRSAGVDDILAAAGRLASLTAQVAGKQLTSMGCDSYRD